MLRNEGTFFERPDDAPLSEFLLNSSSSQFLFVSTLIAIHKLFIRKDNFLIFLVFDDPIISSKILESPEYYSGHILASKLNLAAVLDVYLHAFCTSC